MKELNHTPAPWEVEHTPIAEIPGQWTSFAYVISHNGEATGRPKEAIANAYLIAAAPEMLSLLQRIVKTQGLNHIPELKQECREAIAKATGGAK